MNEAKKGKGPVSPLEIYTNCVVWSHVILISQTSALCEGIFMQHISAKIETQ